MGDPQIGPGKAERFEAHQRDTGRLRVTNNPNDAYAFRTPSLRNVTLTAPYGHAGAYASLKNYLRSHIARGRGLAGYDLDRATLPLMELSKPDLAPDAFAAIFAATKNETLPEQSLTKIEISAILAFLKSLEDPIARKGGRMGIPENVPSGIPVDQ